MLSLLIGPEHVATLGAVLVGLCVILGRRRWATRVALLALGAVALPAALAALWPILPLWLIILMAPLAVLLFVQAVLRALFGEQASGQVVGEWLIRLFDALFRALTWPLRRLWRGW